MVRRGMAFGATDDSKTRPRVELYLLLKISILGGGEVNYITGEAEGRGVVSTIT